MGKLCRSFSFTRGVGRNFSMGVVLNVFFFKKGSYCTDLFPNTLYRKCIKFGPKKMGSSDPSDPSPFPIRPCLGSIFIFVGPPFWRECMHSVCFHSCVGSPLSRGHVELAAKCVQGSLKNLVSALWSESQFNQQQYYARSSLFWSHQL